MILSLLRLTLIPAIFLIGVVGNTLSFLTVTISKSKSSYKVYLAALAAVDTMTLFSLLIQIWLPDTFDIHLHLLSTGFCKFQIYILYVFTAFSTCLVSLLALERAFCLYFPFKVKSICRPKNALITTGILGTFLMTYNTHYFYGLELRSGINSGLESEIMKFDVDNFSNVDSWNNTGLLTFSHRNLSVPIDNNRAELSSMNLDTVSQSTTELETTYFGGSMVLVNNTVNSTALCNSSYLDIDMWNELPLGIGCLTNSVLDDINSTISTAHPKKHIQKINDSFLFSENINKTLTILNNGVEYDPVTNFCGFIDETYANFFQWMVWVDSLLFFCCPFTIIIIANTATWIKVYKSLHSVMSSVAMLAFRRSRHVIILTTLVSLGYLVFVSPITVLLLVESVFVDDMKFIYEKRQSRSSLDFIVQCLYFCNHSFNFYLYILSGKRFRDDFWSVFSVKRKPETITDK